MTRKAALTEHRARLVRRGLVRVEVSVGKFDVELVRRVAAALVDPNLQNETRVHLQRFGAPATAGLKALLASAPLDGIDLDRTDDRGREIDL